ncbi:MAG: type II toxin-antitoxin system VapC family toxin [Planctomycetes bacterium]|nr:type II toxin-antitoxin system VapC family toxin [Planctomycetota bacterium]
MALYYLDASALVKRYVAEKGSAFVTHLTNPGSRNETWLATIGCVELVSALFRRFNMGVLASAAAHNAEQTFRGELHQFIQLIDLNPSILARAMGLAKRHLLRAYDSIQLATMIELQLQRFALNLSLPIFLSADQALNQAALAEGLLVDDPNRYP